MTPGELTVARVSAAKTRGGWLAALRTNMVTAADLIGYAQTDQGAPLRRIMLEDLAGPRPGPVLARLLRETGDTNNPPARLNVAWLLDGRAAGRMDAWRLAVADPSTPWDGWPVTPPPAGGAR